MFPNFEGKPYITFLLEFQINLKILSYNVNLIEVKYITSLDFNCGYYYLLKYNMVIGLVFFWFQREGGKGQDIYLTVSSDIISLSFGNDFIYLHI